MCLCTHREKEETAERKVNYRPHSMYQVLHSQAIGPSSRVPGPRVEAGETTEGFLIWGETPGMKTRKGGPSCTTILPTPELNLKPGTERGRKRHLFKAKAGDQTTLPSWVALGNLGLAPRRVKGQWV